MRFQWKYSHRLDVTKSDTSVRKLDGKIGHWIFFSGVVPPLCPAVWLIFILYLPVRSVLKSYDVLFTLLQTISTTEEAVNTQSSEEILGWDTRMKTYPRKIPTVLLGFQTNSYISRSVTEFIVFLHTRFHARQKNYNMWNVNSLGSNKHMRLSVPLSKTSGEAASHNPTIHSWTIAATSQS